MRVSDISIGGEATQFHTTRWPLVMASAQDQGQAGRAALAALWFGRTFFYGSMGLLQAKVAVCDFPNVWRFQS
jgi:hypothetical protein